MPAWILLLTCMEAFALPIIGAVALVTSKLTTGDSAHAAQRWFFGVFIAVTLITCRTVVTSDPCWLLHTATLAMMVVGALLLPDRHALEQRRLAQPARLQPGGIQPTRMG